MVTSTIPFDRSGVNFGHLRVPHSVNRSAYGHIAIPIAVAKDGDGPTILLTGGVHGDEYEGPLVLYRLMRALRELKVSGRIIIVPSVNHPAFMVGSRVSPIDQLNLNRTFQGDRNGSITEVIAHYVASELLPLADYALDMHSGGSSLQYLPLLLAPTWTDTTKQAETERMVQAFAPSLAVFFDSLTAPGGEDRVFGNAADANGCHFLTGEFGGGSTVNLEGRAMLERGMTGLLHALGVLRHEGQTEASNQPIRRMTMADRDLFAFAPCAGIFEPAFVLGSEMTGGDLAGHIYDPDAPWAPPRDVRFKAAGLAVCIRTFAQVEPGDCLGHLARDL
jgi:predicted deacylase